MPNQVTLTFAGDTAKIEDSFDRVGGSSKKMSKEVDESANSFEKVGGKADNAERNIIGVHDVIDGTATIMQGPGKQGIVAYLQGWADLAGGIAPVFEWLGKTRVATLAKAAADRVAAGGAKVWAAAQWLMNTALLASPITWIIVGIVALVAVVYLIATKTRWFQNIWRVAWSGIKTAASAAWGFIRQIPGWISGAFSRVAGAISRPFRSAFNFIADAWNNTVGRLSWSVPGWVPGIGGYTVSVPHLPHFHSGGVVPGIPGSETLAVLQAGERVQTRGDSSGSEQWIRVDFGDLGEALLRPIAKAVSRRGGQVSHLGVRVINGTVRA